ncbi:hypothetical protein Lalb_Chr24g0400191 [Lupinus albus]|uniref:Uncharacterized protein n=1 Tax=Lupinus albus TaxID=3870 RepID=A0A6A4N4F7_LUPAL|nr:hypothetical protein Lalb_Chr24g0400191 [Lupinus albus]
MAQMLVSFTTPEVLGKGILFLLFYFCIAEDVLSRGIMKLVNDHNQSPVASPKSICTPSHVLYTYDILIFYKGIKKELTCLKQLLLL